MDQQRNATVKHQMFQLSATDPKCPQFKSSLINHLINDRLLDACRRRLTQQHLAQDFNRPAAVALLRFYNLRTKD